MNRPLVAPVNRPPLAGPHCEPAPCQAARIGRAFVPGRGVGGVPLKCAGGGAVGVSPPHFLTAQPRNFFSLLKGRNR